MIAHRGDHPYFKASVAAARRYAQVHVLTYAEPDADRDFADLAASYVHLSGGSVRYELSWCLRRYFLMRDLFRREKISEGWLLDSDLLLVDALPDRSRFPEGTICALSAPPVDDPLDRHFSPHCSFWTLEALESFCNFMINAYARRSEQLRALDRERRSRGITSAMSDMILLGQWGLDDPRVFNTFDFTDGGMIDHNLRGHEQPVGVKLKSRFGNKVLIRRNGHWWTETDEGRLIPLRCVHFQGAAKILIKDFARGRHVSFAVKAWARWSINSLRLFLRHMKNRPLPVERPTLSSS
ncbi:MAG: hypothetical protein NTAFB05_11500 [Nitrobacter sp.]|uniref:hypothetical protein n=1 Tax=Nitrobacter sp. TaxID=29420 RepID=UPI00387DE286